MTLLLYSFQTRFTRTTDRKNTMKPTLLTLIALTTGLLISCVAIDASPPPPPQAQASPTGEPSGTPDPAPSESPSPSISPIDQPCLVVRSNPELSFHIQCQATAEPLTLVAFRNSQTGELIDLHEKKLTLEISKLDEMLYRIQTPPDETRFDVRNSRWLALPIIAQADDQWTLKATLDGFNALEKEISFSQNPDNPTGEPELIFDVEPQNK